MSLTRIVSLHYRQKLDALIGAEHISEANLYLESYRRFIEYNIKHNYGTDLENQFDYENYVYRLNEILELQNSGRIKW